MEYFDSGRLSVFLAETSRFLDYLVSESDCNNSDNGSDGIYQLQTGTDNLTKYLVGRTVENLVETVNRSAMEICQIVENNPSVDLETAENLVFLVQSINQTVETAERIIGSRPEYKIRTDYLVSRQF